MAVSPNDGSITSAELHTSSGLDRPVVISLERPSATSDTRACLRTACLFWHNQIAPIAYGTECSKHRTTVSRLRGAVMSDSAATLALRKMKPVEKV